ncbi:hypothetical protein INT47_001787, partial [Mucor saturninus]
LSQEDFRKLMATPRRPNEDDSHNTFKAPAPKSSGAIFAKPVSMRKKNFKKNFKKENADDEEEEEEEKINYRDRAAERRQHTNDPSDDSQLSTEELLQRTQMEAGQELDAKQLYEQSKYLGGDVNHTHLVKGLDFALLKKIRTDLSNKKEEKEEEAEEDVITEEPMDVDAQNDQDLDQVLEKFERGEAVPDEEVTPVEEDADKPKFFTLMAKNIHDQIMQQCSDEPTARVELFEPGRMAFVFELADEVGHYSDAFAIPTAIIRSKADITAKLSKSGWSEDTQAETKLVIEKISHVMQAVRRGDRHHGSVITPKTTRELTSQPIAMVEDGFMGDIFADAGRDYELDETTTETNRTTTPKNYFQGLAIDEEMAEVVNNDEVNALLSQVTGRSGEKEEKEETEEGTSKRRKYEQVELDADAADIDMFGLSSSALPTSFEEHKSTAYQSGDDGDDDDDDDVDETETKASTQFVDQGTNRNKKAQLTRWDFDTEEEWQKYKSTIEIHPKSAFQFGVKLGDGRKRNRERKGMNDKQRLDRDYQQVKSIMSKKYGKSLDN